MTEPCRPLLAGLIGWPVHQSKSPLIHGHWLQELGIDGSYIRFPVKPGAVEGALRAMAALGVVGVQATMPHKRACFDAVDELSETARAIGAVNTVTLLPDGSLRGHNSDMAGFLEPLASVDLSAKAVTILGAGGAAAAILVGLAAKKPARITIINRSRSGIDALLNHVGDALNAVEICCGDWSQAPDLSRGSALVVNATSLGMAGHPALPFDIAGLPDDALVYDIITHPHETAFLKAAKVRGLQTRDGMHMLIGQAREAFALFYGQPAPNTSDAAIRARLTA